MEREKNRLFQVDIYNIRPAAVSERGTAVAQKKSIFLSTTTSTITHELNPCSLVLHF